MAYGQFVGYEPASNGYDFSTKDGKKLRLVGETAEELRKKLDATAFVAPKPANMTTAAPEPAPPAEYIPPNTTALTGWLRNEPAPAPPKPAEPAPEEKQAALMSWLRGEEQANKFGDARASKDPGTDWKAIEAARPAAPPEGSKLGAFTRSAIPAALDAAALPVTLAGKAAEYFGYPNQAAHLIGQDALESGEFLTRKVDPAQQRREQAEERKNFPASANLGEDVGTIVGGAPSGELGGRAVVGAARGAAQAGKYVASEIAAAGGIKQVAKDVAMAPAHAMLGTGGGNAAKVVASEVEPAIPAWALQKPKAPEYRTPAAVRAKAVAAHKVISEHPDALALRDYMMSGYDNLNKSLRETAQAGKNPPIHVEKQAEKIERVLAAVKDAGLTHNGSTQRGLQLPAGTADKWVQSGAVVNKSFWSTSHNPDVADSFRGYSLEPGHEKVLLKLDQRSGVPVAGPEDEILMPRNKNWVVKEHDTLDDGTRVIELKEVPKLPPGVKPEFSYDTSRLGEAASVAV